MIRNDAAIIICVEKYVMTWEKNAWHIIKWEKKKVPEEYVQGVIILKKEKKNVSLRAERPDIKIL